MAMKFTKAAGSAKKSTIERYKWKPGVNKIRLVGGVLPRYEYWLTNANGKVAPFECLVFNRETESFDNSGVDPVKEAGFKDTRCQWSYIMQGFDMNDDPTKLLVVPLKKTMFAALQRQAADFGTEGNEGGDPTHPELGYELVINRVKTGPNTYNVEYNIEVAKMIKTGISPLTDEQKEVVDNSKDIEELFPRETVEEQRERLDKFLTWGDETAEDEESEEAPFVPF